MKKSLLFGAMLFAMLSGGCVHRELVGFEDHATKPLTAIRVDVTKYYVFWGSREYVFYSCAEQGDKLTCARLCNGTSAGTSDIECPKAYGSGSGGRTNIR